jgi:hypothetical protein
MNKRHAKRWANTNAAIILDSAMGEGFPWYEGFSDADTEKLSGALEEIIVMLRNRGLNEDDPEIPRPFESGRGKSCFE